MMSSDLLAERIIWLCELFPEAVTEGKVDFDKVRASLGDFADTRPERYSFTWAGKRDSIQLLQTPSRSTLVPASKESVSFDRTKHLFIESDNLEALKLLHKAYFEQVKMIYIDPPYNTGNDFVYPDSYADPLDTYLRITGQKDVEGRLLTSNPETSGRYHSVWLSMMYPRLFLARQLLRQDGVIWISIDDIEVANLRLICNEIFGEENFVATFIWEKRTTRENRRVFSFNHDYIVCYAKNKDAFQVSRGFLPLSENVLRRYANPDNDSREEWQSVSLNVQAGHATPAQFYTVTTPGGRKVPAPAGRAWSVTEERMQELIADNRVWFGESGNNIPRLKVFLSEARQGLTPHTLWKAEEVGTNDAAKKALIDLFDGKSVYETPKPIGLIKRMVEISTASSEGDVVMDFFAGSATTAWAVLDRNREDSGNRRFIMIQFPEPTPEGSDARKAGYETVAEIGEDLVKRVIDRMKKEGAGTLRFSDGEEDLGFRVFRLSESNYKPWSGVKELDPEAYTAQMGMFVDPLVDGWRPDSVMWEVALKEGYALSSRVEKISGMKSNTVWRVTDGDKGLSFLICLDAKLDAKTLTSLRLGKDDLFICRDAALDDETAANLALQCHLKTI